MEEIERQSINQRDREEVLKHPSAVHVVSKAGQLSLQLSLHSDCHCQLVFQPVFLFPLYILLVVDRSGDSNMTVVKSTASVSSGDSLCAELDMFLEGCQRLRELTQLQQKPVIMTSPPVMTTSVARQQHTPCGVTRETLQSPFRQEDFVEQIEEMIRVDTVINKVVWACIVLCII